MITLLGILESYCSYGSPIVVAVIDDKSLKLALDSKIHKQAIPKSMYFISPIVVAVTKDQSLKPALDSKIFKKAIHKNKYQIPKYHIANYYVKVAVIGCYRI